MPTLSGLSRRGYTPSSIRNFANKIGIAKGDGVSDIALGNVIGSNIANIGLVLGITAIISTLDVDKDFYKVNWPMLMLMSFALLYFLSFC